MKRAAVLAIGRTLFILWLASLLFFAMVHILPGDPIRALFGFRAPPPDEYERLRSQYGLDDPWIVQLVKYQWNLVHGDLGFSLQGAPVGGLLREAAPVSALLVGIGVMMQLVLGVVAGVISALSRRSFLSALTRVTTVAIMSVPIVVVAGIAEGTYLSVLVEHPTWRRSSTLGIVLGVFAVSSTHIAYVARLAQIQMQAVEREPFLVTARAMGHTRRRIVGRHALKPALPVIVTLAAANVSTFLGGLIVVEEALEIDGLGALAFSGIRERDYAVIVGVLVIATVVSLTASLLADLCGAVLDPRTRT